VVLELECPAEDTSRNMYGRQRREQPTPRSPVRVVLVLDVSHSMSEPHGPTVDYTTNSQVPPTMICNGGSGDFILGEGHWGGDTFIWGAHN